MRILFFLLITLTLNISSLKAQLKSEVSECFELTSIIFRLAGAEEFSYNGLPNYCSDIDSYFAEYKNHELITFVKSLRFGNAVSYDAVSTATARIKIYDGKVSVAKDFDPVLISQLDDRWSEETFNRFVELLNDFYVSASFRDFFDSHADLYEIAISRMDAELSKINTNWFYDFFGQELGSPWVIVSLCNYPCNYAVGNLPYQDCSLGIVIGCRADKDGLPAFSPVVQTTIIHEFCHSFSNPRFYAVWQAIEASADTIFPYVADNMTKIAYGSPKTTLLEWQNRLFTMQYFIDNSVYATSIESDISNQQNLGFIWMNRSIQFMNNFRENRNIFITIDDFMPQLVDFIKNTADNFDIVISEFNSRRPYVVETFPMVGSKLPEGITRIIFKFSHPMSGSHSCGSIDNEDVLPLKYSSMPYWQDEYTYVYPINIDEIEKGQTYGVKLDQRFFQSDKKYSLRNDYEYTIKITE